MNDDAFDRLQTALSAMQVELIARKWDGDLLERCDRSSALRRELWDAITAYRDSWLALYKVL